MKALAVEPIVGKRVLFRPGHVAIRLDEPHHRAYHRLYGLSFPLPDVPALDDQCFDGRSMNVTRPQLAALNRAFATLDGHAAPLMRGAFGDQEQTLTRQFKKTQFLS